MAREIALQTPCGKDWASMMTPADGGRFCGDCRKVVRDLSAMTEAGARALLEGQAGDLCVRYIYDEHGRVFFRGVVSAELVAPTFLLRAKRLAVAALPLAAACSDGGDGSLAASSPTQHQHRVPSTTTTPIYESAGGISSEPLDRMPEATDAGVDGSDGGARADGGGQDAHVDATTGKDGGGAI